MFGGCRALYTRQIVRNTAIWKGDDGAERVAGLDQLGANRYGLYCWRTLRKDNWCAECGRELLVASEALGYDWETRWCIPCAVRLFEFVYWETPERQNAREDRAA